MNDVDLEKARLRATQLADEHVRNMFDGKCTATQHQLHWQRKYQEEYYKMVTPPRRDKLDIILDKLNAM